MEKKVKNIFINGAIAPEKIATSIQHHAVKTEIGAHSIFLGQVRNDQHGEAQVTSIEYTAYEEMALDKCQVIRQAIFAKYPLTCMHIYHSLGEVKVGELCLFVFTSSKHRKAAMEACDEVVERIKMELPIWGKEKLTNHSHNWKENVPK